MSARQTAEFFCVQQPVSGAERHKRFSIEMMLKSELSQKARAFSVENLLTVKDTEDNSEKKKLYLLNSKLQIKNGITAELCCSDLWEEFNRLGTEMLVTRAGRRMFPALKLRLYGLKITANYIVYLDIVLARAARYRYNFNRSEWTIAGPSNNFASTNVYIHPSSPAKGEVWMSHETISFDKVKLTNNRKPLMRDQVSLFSMHKYQPRIHVLEIPTNMKSLESLNLLDCIRQYSETSESFAFEQTNFITVTAYQNQEITNLKIRSNPFAKGFREMSNVKRKKRQHESMSLANPIHINPNPQVVELL